ncbi:MAG: D-alanyl-D-alanine carboxypeptidase/D-alanyl-D-alanine endopeptidase [Solirubrobacteraceae bacterium]
MLAATATAAAAPAARAYDDGDLRRTLAREMRNASSASGAYVRDLDSGRRLYSRRSGRRRVPASVQKLYTTSAALLRLGPRATLDTAAVTDGSVTGAGVLRGDLVLVGGGDPAFGPRTAARLARAVRATGIKRISGAVVGDESVFDERRSGLGRGYDFYLGGVLSGLAYNGSIFRGRPQFDAARFAAARFEALLRRAGVRSSKTAHAGSAPADARTIVTLASPTVRTLIRRTNVPSNNFAAEMLLKTLGARYGGGGTTARGAAVVERTLDAFAVRPRVADGSGLSRRNRTTPRDVVRLLDRMNRPDVRRAFRSSLAIAGRTGTVRRRMRGTPAHRRCRLKTGTLRSTSALAGYCRTRGGRNIAFALLMNHMSNISAAHTTQDRIAAAIARLDGAPATRPDDEKPQADPEPQPQPAPQPVPAAPTGGAGAG